jgi:hypothetical protein
MGAAGGCETAGLQGDCIARADVNLPGSGATGGGVWRLVSNRFGMSRVLQKMPGRTSHARRTARVANAPRRTARQVTGRPRRAVRREGRRSCRRSLCRWLLPVDIQHSAGRAGAPSPGSLVRHVAGAVRGVRDGGGPAAVGPTPAPAPRPRPTACAQLCAPVCEVGNPAAAAPARVARACLARSSRKLVRPAQAPPPPASLAGERVHPLQTPRTCGMDGAGAVPLTLRTLPGDRVGRRFEAAGGLCAERTAPVRPGQGPAPAPGSRPGACALCKD